MGFNKRSMPKDTPEFSSKILHQSVDGPTHDTPWDYWQRSGQLKFLGNSMRPDLAYSVHRCARYNTQAIDAEDWVYIQKRTETWYWGQTHGHWSYGGMQTFVITEHRHGAYRKSTRYILMLAGSQITCSSKLQKETALNTTKAEFAALSEGLRTTIRIMSLIDEISDNWIVLSVWGQLWGKSDSNIKTLSTGTSLNMSSKTGSTLNQWNRRRRFQTY